MKAISLLHNLRQIFHKQLYSVQCSQSSFLRSYRSAENKDQWSYKEAIRLPLCQCQPVMFLWFYYSLLLRLGSTSELTELIPPIRPSTHSNGLLSKHEQNHFLISSQAIQTSRKEGMYRKVSRFYRPISQTTTSMIVYIPQSLIKQSISFVCWMRIVFHIP